MKITGTRPDGSLDARVESNDGWLRSTLEAAKSLAETTGRVVHFSFNGRRVAVGPETKLKDIELLYNFDTNRLNQEIGPNPAPEDVPKPQLGTFVLDITVKKR